jgi:hypothetical protein
MKRLVAENYPGTRTAITEYNWGALNSLNGALAQADILGIFGREGLDLATLWAPPSRTDPGASAFRAYLNYDGAGARFGETSVSARSSDQDRLAVYGAQRAADGATTLVVINKTGDALSSPLTVAGRTDTATARVFRYSGANLAGLVRDADATVTAGALTSVYPANSITVIELPAPRPGPAVRAQYSNSDTAANGEVNNTIKPTLAVANPGERVALSRITLRSWFTRDLPPGGATTVRAECLTAAVGCTRVTQRVVPLATARPGADAYLEVGFTGAAGSVGRGNSTSGQLSFRLARAGGGTFDETDDHSWQDWYGRWRDSPTVTAYLDGRLVWGQEP